MTTSPLEECLRAVLEEHEKTKLFILDLRKRKAKGGMPMPEEEWTILFEKRFADHKRKVEHLFAVCAGKDRKNKMRPDELTTRAARDKIREEREIAERIYYASSQSRR